MNRSTSLIAGLLAGCLVGCGAPGRMDETTATRAALREGAPLVRQSPAQAVVPQLASRVSRKAFSSEEIDEIRALLRDLPSESYRVVLPSVERDGSIGSAVYGTLPVTEVHKIAAVRGLEFDDTGNVQTILQSCNGGGPGSHVESQTPGTDIGRRIETILANLDQSAFVFLTE